MLFWKKRKSHTETVCDRPIYSHTRQPEAIDYALSVARLYRSFIAKMGVSEKSVLEIGPGPDFGAQIICADYANFVVADRFLAPWDDSYHPDFYTQLREAWGPSDALEKVIRQRGYDGVIKTIPSGAEQLGSEYSGKFNLVLSNAVLEHVDDLTSCAKALNKVTAMGGMHSHQIDLRDHANFSKPLEYLLDSDVRSDTEVVLRGHPRRSNEIAHIFKDCGFAVHNIAATAVATSEYLADFMPRLRNCSSLRRAFTADDVSILGARFAIEKIREIDN